MNIFSKGQLLKSALLLAAVLAASLEGHLSKEIQHWYAYPSAVIACVFLGVSPVLTEANEVIIPLFPQAINVTSKCSAFGFFCLLYALLVINLMKVSPQKRKIDYFVLALPLAYGITIFVNGCRVVCAYYVHRVGKLFLPENFQGALHLGVGIALFLSTLIAITFFFEKFNHTRSQIR